QGWGDGDGGDSGQAVAGPGLLARPEAEKTDGLGRRWYSRNSGDAREGLDLQRLGRSEEHTSELQSRFELVCRLLLEKKESCSRSSPRCSRSGSGPASSAPGPTSPSTRGAPHRTYSSRAGGAAPRATVPRASRGCTPS